jgi:hypothetical protein
MTIIEFLDAYGTEHLPVRAVNVLRNMEHDPLFKWRTIAQIEQGHTSRGNAILLSQRGCGKLTASQIEQAINNFRVKVSPWFEFAL